MCFVRFSSQVGCHWFRLGAASNGEHGGYSENLRRPLGNPDRALGVLTGALDRAEEYSPHRVDRRPTRALGESEQQEIL